MLGDLPSGPEAGTLCSNAGGPSSTPGQGTKPRTCNKGLVWHNGDPGHPNKDGSYSQESTLSNCLCRRMRTGQELGTGGRD